MNFSISPGSGLLRQNVTARAKPRPLVPAASLLGGDSGQKPSSREQDARQSGPRLGVTPVASIDDAIKSMTDVRRALRRDVGRALDSITQFRPQAREALEGLLSERTAAVPRPAAPTESPAGATLTHATITLDAPLYESDRASEPTEQHDVPVFLVPRQAGPSSAPALAGEGPRSFVLSSASPSGRRALEDFTRTGSLVVAQNDSGFSVELTVTPVAAAQPREQGDVALFTPVGSFQGRSTRDELGNQTLVVDEAEVTAPIPGIPGGFVGVELEDAAFSRMTNESHGTVSVVAGIDVANTLGISAEQELFTFESGPRGAAQFAAASGSGPSQAGKLSLVSAGPTGRPDVTRAAAPDVLRPTAPGSPETLREVLDLPTVSLDNAETPENAVLVIADTGSVTTVEGPLIAAIASGLIAGVLVSQRISAAGGRAGAAAEGAVETVDARVDSAAAATQETATDILGTAEDLVVNTAELTRDAAVATAEVTRDATNATADVIEQAATTTVGKGGEAVGAIADVTEKAVATLVEDPVSTVSDVAKTVLCFGIFCE